MVSRRDILQLGAAGALSIAGATGVASSARAATGDALTRSALSPRNMPVPFAAAFLRPPELLPYASGEDAQGPFAKYALTQKVGSAQIVPGLHTTLAGYNGIFPGPTIRVEQGTRTEVRIRNGLTPKGLLHPKQFNTVTHLHGSASAPQYDGYANDFTAPGYVKTYKYPNSQGARTLWYHDHNHGVTAENVYSGLAGFYPLSDEAERAQLPQGEFDVPLSVTDALFKADGSLGYNDTGHLGLWGDVIMVNGVPWPTMKVKPRIYRFRLLVASISRSYRPALSTGDPVHLVGTDGGLMPIVQPVSSWRQGTGERVEFLIDFRKYGVGQKVDLRNLSNKNNVDFTNTGKIMRFEVVADSPPQNAWSRSISAIPITLSESSSNLDPRSKPTMDLTRDMVTAKRTLRLERTNGEWTINGVTWVDVEASGLLKIFGNPQPYAVEEWTFVNQSGGWYHPVHAHLVDAKIIARNTNGGKPFAWELGPKDVIYAGENESITMLMQFDTGAHGGGRYMFHCHNLPHEDHDMMVQFSVGDVHQNDPVASDPPVPDTAPLDAFPPVYRPPYLPGT